MREKETITTPLLAHGANVSGLEVGNPVAGIMDQVAIVSKGL